MADEDQEIAGAHRPAAAFENFATVDHSLDAPGDEPRQPFARRISGPPLARRPPFRLFLARQGFGQRPEFDPPRLADPGGLMDDAEALQIDTLPCRLQGEDCVDGVEDRLSRAEGNDQRHRMELASEVGEAAVEMSAHLFQRTGIRTLEAEDRLFYIADGKDRALDL